MGVGKNFHYINGKFDYHQRVYCLNSFEKDVYGKYIYFVFSEKFGERVLKLSAKNSVDSVRRDMITLMEINLPPLPEQAKIANFLTAIDEKIQGLKEKKSLLEEYKKGLMQQIFSQKLRFKHNDDSDFPDWEEKTLGEVYNFYSTNSFSEVLNLTKTDLALIMSGIVPLIAPEAKTSSRSLWRQRSKFYR